MKKYLLTLLACSLGSICTVQAETYKLDQSHTDITFKVRHLGLSKVRGVFKKFDGQVEFDPSDLSATKATLRIDVDSVDTGNAKRDAHLKNEDFFEIAKYPEIIFQGTGAAMKEGNLVLKGALTIKDTTRPLEIEVELSGPVDSPFQEGVKIIALTAEGELERREYGVSNSGASDKAIGNKVEWEVSFEAQK